MIRILLLLSAFATISCSSISDKNIEKDNKNYLIYNQQNVENICRNEHTRHRILNNQKYNDCLVSQEESYNEFLNTIKSNKNLYWLDESIPVIWERCTKNKTTNYHLANLFLESEIRDYKSLLSEYDKNILEEGFDIKLESDKLSMCINKHKMNFMKDKVNYNRWGYTLRCYQQNNDE